MEEEKPAEGWGKPKGSQRWHFFQRGRSLCKKWAFEGYLSTDEKTDWNDCLRCARLRKKQKES